ncbi:PTS sugar transporter subunit IIC [Companilactobacillus sp. HBUAS59544]|uniref:PTS sugar transporter subunit IIC n=1 Tax=Companilactobacillus sp. HBUAS59544 TaxID=3109363 RepID=UPI002FF2DFC0
MNGFTKVINEKIIPPVLKFVNIKAIVALKDGILYTLPLLMVGSLFTLIANFPYKPVTDFLTKNGWMDPLNQINGATFSIIALIAVTGVSYQYAKNEKVEPFASAVIALSSFIILTRSNILSGKTLVPNVIPKDWTGGQGMISAIVVGLLVGWIYSECIKHKLTIKLPPQVPSGVANSFAALIPAFLIISGTFLIYALIHFVWNTTLIEGVYKIIQIPLQGVTDSIWGVIAYCTIATFFWWFGVHGGTIVTSIFYPILLANLTANQGIVESGKALTVANGAHIFTDQFTAILINMTGTGATIGLAIYMFFFAKSVQTKELGKLAIIPSLFNINEPIIYGAPIVMNPFLFIPFVLTPTLIGLIMYGLMSTGILPLFSGVSVPWTTPPIISGFILGGWRMALAQVFIILLSVAIYFPFIRKVDQINLEKEQSMKQK